MQLFATIIFIFISVATFSSQAMAWGERGHDLIARVAARLIAEDKEYGKHLGATFVIKEHMLAHLANVPDIVWRNVGKEVDDANNPTHYIDLEYLTMNPSIDQIPKTAEETEAAIKKLCSAKPKGYVCPDSNSGIPKITTVGTAPFRAQQLFSMMQAAFQRAADEQKKDVEKPTREFTTAINEALLYGGLLAHFIGDLANPYHTTRDYNGYEIGAGGVHSYFESEIINAFDLKFDGEVFARAIQLRENNALKKILASKKSDELDPLQMAWALTVDSYRQLKTLQDLDFKVAITKKGREEKGMKIKAERRPANTTANHYRDIALARIGQGAAALAWFWTTAWKHGGRPDLKEYHSWDYPTAPAFINPSIR